MNFENIIKKISSFIAAVAVFFIAAGMYLSWKGFVMTDGGEIVLVKSAQAQDLALPDKLDVPANYVMPDEHSLGKANAPVTLYEYSSFGCFHCADFHLDTLPLLKEKYIDKGLLRLVFVAFPIDKASMDGALLAECVAPDKYFPFVEVLFEKQRDWSLSRNPQKVLMQYAALSGLGQEKAKACLKNDENAREILTNRQNGVTQMKIQGTPSFVIKSKDGFEILQGAQSFETFDDVLQQKIAVKNKN